MTWILDAAIEKALHTWVKMGLPAEFVSGRVIWGDAKEQEEQADRPPYPYAEIKVTAQPPAPLGAAIRWGGNRLTAIADGLPTSAIIDGVLYTINPTGLPWTREQIAVNAAHQMNLNPYTHARMIATAEGPTVTMRWRYDNKKKGVPIKAWSCVPVDNCTMESFFIHVEHGTFTLSVNIFARKGDHFKAARMLMNSTRFAASMKVLRSAGLGYGGAEGPRDLSFIPGAEEIHRAQVDINFNYAAEVEEVVPQVDTVEVSGSIESEKGTEIPITATITV